MRQTGFREHRKPHLSAIMHGQRSRAHWTADGGQRMLHNWRVASVARHVLLPLVDVDAMWIEMAILTWSRTNLSERRRIHSAKNYHKFMVLGAAKWEDWDEVEDEDEYDDESRI
ncbi:uncharacterized protein LOC121467055 [Drosophila elegans]|uniref:uncharacterized protein LOC121467055 n=1 Tax=Drosophila elegans TaxID=30023 RepID=UPI001BC84A0B|nr:uncharacterized protein LOC121467055 [Drosophila elegans]